MQNSKNPQNNPQNVENLFQDGTIPPEYKEKLHQPVNQQDLDQLLAKLSPSQSKKLEQLLSDKAATQKLLSTPQARALMQKLMGK